MAHQPSNASSRVDRGWKISRIAGRAAKACRAKVATICLGAAFWFGWVLLSGQALAQDCVILLHGLAKSERDMRKLAQALGDDGAFFPVNVDYPSRKDSIERLAEPAIQSALEKCPQKSDRKIHFVTHSMGGILVRQYLRDRRLEGLGRVVMLGPPNNGSEVVDVYRHVPGFAAFFGPAGLQLGTDANSAPIALGAANFDAGVIAGTHSIDPISSAILPGVDDGKVTLKSTMLSGMCDHLALPVTHLMMMKNAEVIEQTIFFLKNGSFDRSGEQSPHHFSQRAAPREPLPLAAHEPFDGSRPTQAGVLCQ